MGEPNYLAIVAAAVIPMVCGGLWYSRLLFARQFMALIAKSEEELKKDFKPARDYSLTFMSSLVMSIGLHQVISMASVVTFVGGMSVGFLAWTAFIVTSNLSTVVFEGRKMGLYYLSMGYNLLCLLAMGGVLAVWR